MPRTVFIAWKKLSRRTRDLAKELNAELLFIPSRFFYIEAWIKTRDLLREAMPDIIILQLPQGPLLLRAITLSREIKSKIIADVHTGFVYHPGSLRGFILNSLFKKLLNRVDLVLVHNKPIADFISRKLKIPRSNILVVYDPLPQIPENVQKPEIEDITSGSYIVAPSSWASDEPLDYIAREFLESSISKEYRLVITGNPEKRPILYRRLKTLSENSGKKIIITGYLPYTEYMWLLQNSRAIIAATSREYTMLSAIWEAIVYKKLFIVSKTYTLRDTIGRNYPCFFGLRESELKKILDRCIGSFDEEINSSLQEASERLEKLSKATITLLSRILNSYLVV